MAFKGHFIKALWALSHPGHALNRCVELCNNPVSHYLYRHTWVLSQSHEETGSRRNVVYCAAESRGLPAVTRDRDARQPEHAAPDVSTHWRGFADQWALFGSPLRPCEDDLRIFEELLSSGAGIPGANPRKRAWLLGVTREIAAARWLGDIDFVAAERVQAMIDSAWPGNTGHRWAIRADWLNAPFSDESFDLVIGDGCLTVVGYLDGLAALLASVHRCLRRDGQLMLRLFCRPDVAETPEEVMTALRAGEIGSIHAFKWRLAMAVQGAAGAHDVGLHDAWTVWDEPRWNARTVAEGLGWSPAQVGTIEFWRGSSARYVFMRFDEAVGHLHRAGFDLVVARTGSYELAERCPLLLLRKRQAGSEGEAA